MCEPPAALPQGGSNLTCGARHIGETVPWLTWIAEHHGDLPDFALFLHGDVDAWHTKQRFVERVLRGEPRDVAESARR